MVEEREREGAHLLLCFFSRDDSAPRNSVSHRWRQKRATKKSGTFLSFFLSFLISFFASFLLSHFSHEIIITDHLVPDPVQRTATILSKGKNVSCEQKKKKRQKKSTKRKKVFLAKKRQRKKSTKRKKKKTQRMNKKRKEVFFIYSFLHHRDEELLVDEGHAPARELLLLGERLTLERSHTNARKKLVADRDLLGVAGELDFYPRARFDVAEPAFSLQLDGKTCEEVAVEDLVGQTSGGGDGHGLGRLHRLLWIRARHEPDEGSLENREILHLHVAGTDFSLERGGDVVLGGDHFFAIGVALDC